MLYGGETRRTPLLQNLHALDILPDGSPTDSYKGMSLDLLLRHLHQRDDGFRDGLQRDSRP